MEKLGVLTHKWRYAVIALEAIIATGCCYFGWRALGPAVSPRSPVQVQRAPAIAVDPIGVLTLPWHQPAGTPARSSPRSAKPRLGTDALARLDHDDLELYRRQWQVLQALTDGVRRYLEQRVVPRLLSH